MHLKFSSMEATNGLKISQVYCTGHREFMNKHNVSMQSARQYKNNQFIFKNQVHGR